MASPPKLKVSQTTSPSQHKLINPKWSPNKFGGDAIWETFSFGGDAKKVINLFGGDAKKVINSFGGDAVLGTRENQTSGPI